MVFVEAYSVNFVGSCVFYVVMRRTQEDWIMNSNINQSKCWLPVSLSANSSVACLKPLLTAGDARDQIVQSLFTGFPFITFWWHVLIWSQSHNGDKLLDPELISDE